MKHSRRGNPVVSKGKSKTDGTYLDTYHQVVCMLVTNIASDAIKGDPARVR